MRQRELVIGGAMILGGAAVFLNSVINYQTGTLSDMGPGMLPAILGCILAGFGVLIALESRLFAPEPIVIPWRRQGLVVLGVVAFGALVIPFGLFPAIIALVVISSLADRKLGPVGLTLLCATLCAGSWLVFSFGLGLNLHMLDWPF